MRQLEGPNESRRKTKEILQFTRSKTSPFDKNTCFFCDGKASYKYPLHDVATSSAGESLNEAIRLSKDDSLRVKLSTAIDAEDAHAIDIKYHKNCCLTNVTNFVRKATSPAESSDLIGEISARIELMAITEVSLRGGQILTMAELQSTYEEILKANEVSKCAVCNRKTVKALLQSEIPDVEFHRLKRANEPDRVSVKQTRDDAIRLKEDIKARCNEEMKTLFDAAATLRRVINRFKCWKFTGTLGDSENIVPEELYRFCKWLILGSKREDICQAKIEDVKKRAISERSSQSQTTISMCLTERQSNNKKAEALRQSREIPQQLAVGLAVHQATRSKNLVNMLHGFGLSVEYNRVMRVESQIDATVLQRMEDDGGMYIPPDVVKNRYVFFAIDNVDFAEDTYDGKRTLHGAAMAIY